MCNLRVGLDRCSFIFSHSGHGGIRHLIGCQFITGTPHTFTHFSIANPNTGMFLGVGRKPENLEETYSDRRRTVRFRAVRWWWWRAFSQTFLTSQSNKFLHAYYANLSKKHVPGAKKNKNQFYCLIIMTRIATSAVYSPTQLQWDKIKMSVVCLLTLQYALSSMSQCADLSSSTALVRFSFCPIEAC